MPRRRRTNLALWGSIFGTLLGLMAWVLAATAWDLRQAMRQTVSEQGWSLAPRIDWLLWDRCVEAIVTAWVFALGASIGSFLNVVAYRMPLGIGLSRSGSRCPWCLGAIRPRDNIPIFGWLGLKGRCHTCHLPISPRYPIVEGVTGLLFAIVFVATIGSGGAWIPGLQRPLQLDLGAIILDGRWDLIFLLLQQVTVLSYVWAAALMIFDGHAPPLRFWLTGFIGLMVAAFGLPLLERLLAETFASVDFAPVALYPLGSGLPLPKTWPESLQSGIAALAGAAVGLSLGGIVATIGSRSASRHASDLTSDDLSNETASDVESTPLAADTSPETKSTAGPAALIGMLGLIGLGVGWQTLLPIAAISGVSLGICAATAGSIGFDRSRHWGFVWTAGLVVVLGSWSFWVGWYQLSR